MSVCTQRSTVLTGQEEWGKVKTKSKELYSRVSVRYSDVALSNRCWTELSGRRYQSNGMTGEQIGPTFKTEHVNRTETDPKGGKHKSKNNVIGTDKKNVGQTTTTMVVVFGYFPDDSCDTFVN